MLLKHDGDLSIPAYESFLAQETISCDTETTGLDWLGDRLALVQLHSIGTGTHLVKVDSEQQGTLVRRLIEDPKIRKVFHHAPFDLAFLKAAWGVDAHNVVCTKIASKLLHGAESIDHSLQSLLERRLGVRISKGPVRTSDWEASELSDEQVQYAQSDVVFLLPLLENLERALAAKNRLELFQQCCSFLHVRARTDQLLLGDVFSY